MICIIGCGPYGLSLAAYLQRLGVDYRLIGRPMSTWEEGMILSARMRSHVQLSCPDNPDGLALLKNWLKENATEENCSDEVRLSTQTFLRFMEYFIAHNNISRRDFGVLATRVSPADGAGYTVELSDGRRLHAKQVVFASGLQDAQRLPDWASLLPPGSVTHSSQLRAHKINKESRYLVVGGAQSAAEAVELLLAHDCHSVAWAVRRHELNWNSVHLAATPERWAKMLHLRRVFPFSSSAYRHANFNSLLPPSLEPDMRYLADRIMPLFGRGIETVSQDASGAWKVVFQNGEHLLVDHIITCTGYQPRLSALTFDIDALLERMDVHADLPVLTEHAESSWPGVFFSGAMAALRFGPQSNFIFGTEAITPSIIAKLLQQ